MTLRKEVTARISTHANRTAGLRSIELSLPKKLPPMESGICVDIEGGYYSIDVSKGPYKPGKKLFMLVPVPKYEKPCYRVQKFSGIGCDIEFPESSDVELGPLIEALNLSRTGDASTSMGKTLIKAMAHPREGTFHFYMDFGTLL